jgi:hypothetical protein
VRMSADVCSSVHHRAVVSPDVDDAWRFGRKIGTCMPEQIHRPLRHLGHVFVGARS